MKIISFIFIVLIIAACSSYDEVSRVSAPSGLVDAVLIESNGGATTSFNYHIFLEEKSLFGVNQTKVGNLYGAVRSKSAYGINLKWLDDKTLQLEYLRAQDTRLKINAVEIDNVIYSIKFKSGVTDHKAPPGGMLYNLQGRSHG